MKSIKVDLSRDLEYIEIISLADEHIGDIHANEKLTKEKIDYVKNNINAYAIINGDLINNATRRSVSDSYSEVYSPMEEIQIACDLLEPIKDKILAVTQGNHEFRTYKTEGIDIIKIVCMQLGISDKYSPEGALLFVRFGKAYRKETNGSGENRKQCYTIYMQHGSGGGRKEGAKAIRLVDMACVVDSDIYIHSHTHLPMIMKQNFFRVDTRNSTVSEVTKLFVNTGASLSYGGYGQSQGYKPASTDTPIIYLNGRKKEMTAKM